MKDEKFFLTEAHFDVYIELCLSHPLKIYALICRNLSCPKKSLAVRLKELLKWNKKHFLSFLKGFQLPK